MKKEGNFLTAHYDWIAVAVGAAVLAVGVVFFIGAQGTDGDELAGEKRAAIERMTPGGEAVATANLADFTRTMHAAKTPVALAAVSETPAGNFLASEARIACTNCHAAVVQARACPLCNAPLVEEKKEDLDADGDGLPNDWEKKYGLNPKFADDADEDKDKDGFTNAEEYAAKTDPTDKNDHPDYLNYLKVQLPLKETTLSFHFTGVYKVPAGLKFQFKDPSRAKEYDRGNYAVMAGEEIGKSGFVVREYVEKSEKRKMGGGMEKKVDASEAVVERKSDGKRIAMKIGTKAIPVDVQAVLAYSRENKTFTVVPGTEVELNGNKYTVKAIKKTAKGAVVTVSEVKSGKIRDISALEQ